MMILILIIITIVFYIYSTRNFDYWKKKNVKYDPPILLFGSHIRNTLCTKSVTEIIVELYQKYPNEKVIGYYRGRTPVLIVKDLNIARRILMEDFPYFYKRGSMENFKIQKFSQNLFLAEGDTWRLLRQRQTPAFSSAKLRAMFPLVVRCAERLQQVVEVGCGEIDARELMARFTTEFIGACGLGIEMDTINNERSRFRELGQRIFTNDAKRLILKPIAELFPSLLKFVNILDKSLEKSIISLVEEIRLQRNYKPVGRNDFIDLLLKLQAKGTIKGESIEKVNEDGSPVAVEMEMDLECMAAQVFVFFLAGFETSSSTFSYALHELAFNPEVQTKVQEEIDQVMSKYNNRMCYDAISEMNLLHMTFKEGMRIFPSVGNLNRMCTKRYTIPELGITIDPGVMVMVPVQAIHLEEKYYDNPREFRPERFLPEAMQQRHKCAYVPFGKGPRACIGERLGLMQSLAGLAAILHKFTVEPAATSRRQLKINPLMTTIQGIEGGLPLIFKSRMSNAKV